MAASASPTDLETRALAALMGRQPLGELFMTALRRANQLFGAALLLQVAELRRAGDPVERALARTKELELQLAFAFQTIDVLLERLHRVPPVHRPRYRKADRARILHHKDVFHLSCHEVARLYALTRSTVHRWVVDCVAPKRPTKTAMLVKAATSASAAPPIGRPMRSRRFWMPQCGRCQPRQM